MADILRLPKDARVLSALGRAALANSKLDYVLLLTVKTICGQDLTTARDELGRVSSKRLREEVRKFAAEHISDQGVIVEIEKMLKRAEAASAARNRLIHNITYYDKRGQFLHRDGNEPPLPYPTASEINAIASNLMTIAYELNQARKTGFIWRALGRPERILSKQSSEASVTASTSLSFPALPERTQPQDSD
jgi:hypothetical protein